MCSTVIVDPSVLSPVDHSLRPVTVTGATDVDGDAVVVRITGVTQDEPVNGLGDGDTGPDAVAGTDLNRVSLRAERSETGDGRAYTLTYLASDGRGGDCSGTVKVGVPVNQGSRGAAVQSVPSFDSSGS